jgi:hypothetical protein
VCVFKEINLLTEFNLTTLESNAPYIPKFHIKSVGLYRYYFSFWAKNRKKSSIIDNNRISF